MHSIGDDRSDELAGSVWLRAAMNSLQSPNVGAAAGVLEERLRTSPGQHRGSSAGHRADVCAFGMAASIPNHIESLLTVEVIDSHFAKILFEFVVNGNEGF